MSFIDYYSPMTSGLIIKTCIDVRNNVKYIINTITVIVSVF